MPTKSEHRAAIRHAVITAAMDLREFQWGQADDRLLDIIDKWLDHPEPRSNVEAVGSALLTEQRSAQEKAEED